MAIDDEHRSGLGRHGLFLLDIAREDRLRAAGSGVPATSACGVADMGEVARVGRHRQQVEQLRRRSPA